MGSELLTKICLENGFLEYEITSVFSEPERVSGKEIIRGDTIPEINSYEVYNIMKAKLIKEK